MYVFVFFVLYDSQRKWLTEIVYQFSTIDPTAEGPVFYHRTLIISKLEEANSTLG